MLYYFHFSKTAASCTSVYKTEVVETMFKSFGMHSDHSVEVKSGESCGSKVQIAVQLSISGDIDLGISRPDQDQQ